MNILISREKFTVVTRHTGEAGAERRLVGRGASRLWGTPPRQGAVERPRRGVGGFGGVPRRLFYLFSLLSGGARYVAGVHTAPPSGYPLPGEPHTFFRYD